MPWKAVTLKVGFVTAQFKEHSSRLVKRTYLIPPPSVVAGFFGAIMGYSLSRLCEKSDELYAGGELLNLEGRTVTYVRIFKIDRGIHALKKLIEEYHNITRLSPEKRKEVIENIGELLTIKESEELYRPVYKFAIASTDPAFIEELHKRIKERNFAYEPFGGNDYHLVEFIGDDVKVTDNVFRSKVGRGYCPADIFETIESKSYNIVWQLNALKDIERPVVIPARIIANVNKEFIQVYRANIIVKEEQYVVDDGESKVFIYKVKDFLVCRGIT